MLVDLESRLKALLTGDEPILEAQVIVRAVLEDRFIAHAEGTIQPHPPDSFSSFELSS